MNELLQKHGCANVFTIPTGLRELMSDISREVLREQPVAILDFIANYLSALLITREHGILAVRILNDLCDCKPSVSEHLLQLGLDRDQVDILSQVIKEEIEDFEPVESKEKVREIEILKKILARTKLDEEMSANVCQVARNAHRDYWYKKQLMEKQLETRSEEPWEIAAERTLELYKRTKPSFSELTRATEKIQAAYRGYHVRRNLLPHLKPKQQTKKKGGPKAELPGPPLDIAGSREIDLGPVVDLKVIEDDIAGMFDGLTDAQLGLNYDPTKPISHINDIIELKDYKLQSTKSAKFQGKSGIISTKSLTLDVEKGKSGMDDIGVIHQLRLPSQVEAKQRESHLISIAPEVPPSLVPSQLSERGRQSRSTSQMPQIIHSHHRTTEELPRISFSEAKHIIADIDDDHEVPEELQVVTLASAEVDEITQAVQLEENIAEAISEDEHTDEAGESAPTTSVPTVTAETAGETDVEDDEEEMASTEDEQ